jgi:hypothetical protein
VFVVMVMAMMTFAGGVIAMISNQMILDNP